MEIELNYQRLGASVQGSGAALRYRTRSTTRWR